jgi:hypothetical protein
MRRPTWIAILATALGGLAVGLLRPTNSWDWITYLVLGMVGLLFAIYLRRERLTRHTLLAWVGQVGWFFAAQTLAALPFLTYFATSYNAARSFEGNKTPIWVYLTIHGLFLFIVVSLLVWQTARLLQRLYVRDFVGRAWSLLVATGLAAVALVTLIFVGLSGQIWLFDFPFPVALIALPLIAWCGLLFLVPDQSRELRIVYALTALALAVSLGVEIVVLEGDIGRQNTFFKFYMLGIVQRGWRRGPGLDAARLGALAQHGARTLAGFPDAAAVYRRFVPDHGHAGQDRHAHGPAGAANAGWPGLHALRHLLRRLHAHAAWRRPGHHRLVTG